MSLVKVRVEDAVLTAVLSDAGNRNALGSQIVEELREALDRANSNPDIRALVITNEGPVFCAGGNLKERSKDSKSPADLSPFATLLAEMQDSKTPVVGRIAGHVAGGGMGLVAAMDISVASHKAQFSFPEIRIGLAPAIIAVVCLPKMLPGRAREAFLRGHRFSAREAVESGLITRAVPADELDGVVREVTADLCKAGPRAVGVVKQVLGRLPAMNREEAFAWTSDLSAQMFISEEAIEGMGAFLEKRSPAWIK